jgi:hypothetical protein
MSPTVLLTTALAAFAVHVDGWTVLRINQESAAVPSGATVPLCQAIPVTQLTARLHGTAPGHGVRVRVRLRVPGHAPRDRWVRVRRRTRVAFTPRGLRLRHEAFPEGTYRLAVRRHGDVLARATLHLRGGGTC